MGQARALKLRYTPRALAELDDILAYIRERSPHGAQNVQQRIQTIERLILQHPGVGHLTSRPPLRRMAVSPYPYLVFYVATDEEVIVIGLRHGARDPSTMPG